MAADGLGTGHHRLARDLFRMGGGTHADRLAAEFRIPAWHGPRQGDGGKAHGHPADWSQERTRRVPTLAGMLGFIADYEAARRAPFTAAERRGARAWAAYWIAYGAWISVRPGERDWPADSWPALLRECGEDLLRGAL